MQYRTDGVEWNTTRAQQYSIDIVDKNNYKELKKINLLAFCYFTLTSIRPHYAVKLRCMMLNYILWRVHKISFVT